MKPNYMNMFKPPLKSQAMLLERWSAPLNITMAYCTQLAGISQDIHDQLAKQCLTTFNPFAPSAFFPMQMKSRDSAYVDPIKKIRRTAVVTGGIGGIGTGICKRLATDRYQVIATYIKAEQDQAINWQKKYRREGLEIDIIECDVADFDACKKMAKALDKKYGRIDILVNCAGITRDTILRKMEQDSWHAVLDTNLDSIFNVTRNVINGMIKRRYGRIVNISSVNAHRGQFGQTNYAAAKAGMIGFTKSLARELAKNGITVNTVSPGYVSTSMVEAMPENIKKNIITKIPVGRLGKPSEIGDAVAFLVDQNSSYITGADMPVNGGLFMG